MRWQEVHGDIARLTLLLGLAGPVGRAADPGIPFCPRGWEPAVIYYQSFDADKGEPEINTAGLQIHARLGVRPGGFRGKCGSPEGASDPQRVLRLVSPGLDLSPHRPLTILFWWAVPQDLPPQGGFDLIYLVARQGFISTFARGGPWCGLADTAGVVQVYGIPGISNVNGVYDTRWREHLGLRAGQWHHTAMVISAASLVTVYTDGQRIFETRTQGRPFAVEDGFRSLNLGGGVCLDEVLILRRPLDAESIAEYAAGMWRMREAYGW